MISDEEQSQESAEQARRREDRLLLPLLIPILSFLFGLLVIYGLSRIYLEFNEYSLGGVTMATPLAIFVALAILFVALYFSGKATISGMQVASVGLLAVVLLTTGGIWAAVRDDDQIEGEVTGIETETPAPEGIGVSLAEFDVTLTEASAPAGEVIFNVTNDGASTHNLRVISTSLAPGDLPYDDDAFEVPEDEVDIVARTANLEAEESVQVVVELAAGPYVLICNVPPHYDSGMHVAFTVE